MGPVWYKRLTSAKPIPTKPFPQSRSLFVQMTKEIILTQGMFSLIDDSDFDLVSQYTWHASSNGKTFYAETCMNIEQNQKTLRMHRLIMGLDFGDKRRVDHRDGNGLLNTRNNLRLATNSQNNHNARTRSDNTSGYRGVKCNKSSKNKWIAEISDGDKRRYIGSFPDAISAAKAYDEAALEIFGEFSKTNFSETA